MGGLPGGGGAVELKPLASYSTSFVETNPSEIGMENWAAADKAAREIIRKVQPTSVSGERRKNVVDYIQRIIRNCLGAEVFPYGSVPLKTYLPDGDIDLTTFNGLNIEDSLAEDMKSVLEEEEKNTAGEFVVKDVQLIRAEVKIVKCIVQDVVVDISFNQIGGLCTLCFLEQVDRLIGRDHLFKRSIILIKAWCYYESRILGAHHGLISTYALETLVLYIFHLYHSTLDGPLAVLYKFLDYFSKFDWETYCISLNGPIRLSSLPAIVAEIPEDSDRDLLLSRDFLRSCIGMFSVPSRSTDKNARGFQQKHLNIIDPLKENNNLGRSVSKGNYYRIRSAFTYGARKLARILSQPQDSIANELHRFFANTMARLGGGWKPSLQDFDQSLIYSRPINGYHDEYTVSTREFQPGSCKSHQDLIKAIERKPNTDPGAHLHGESVDLATSGLGGLKISSDQSKCQNFNSDESDGVVFISKPHKFFSESKPHDCSAKDKNPDPDDLGKCENDLTDVRSGHGPASSNGEPESLNSSDNLTGDYDNYLRYLHYGRWCYEHSLGMHSLAIPHLQATTYRPNSPWDSLLPVSHYKQNGFSHQHLNGFHPSPAVYTVQPVLLPGTTYRWDDVTKPRGMGTYFPNTNLPLQGQRPSATKGRSQGPTRSPRTNGRSEPSSSHEPSEAQLPADKALIVKCADSYLPFLPHQIAHPNAGTVYIQPEGVVELEPENDRPQRPVSSPPRTFSGVQKSEDRILLRSGYTLKDEDDFPPL